MARPEPWENPGPEKYHFEAVTADINWQIVDRVIDRKPCRWTLPGRKQCRQPSAAKLNRSRFAGSQWWHYCADHMYGRWIEDGQVMRWRLVKNEGK